MSSHLLSTVLFGISSNIDCLAVGLSYGIRKKHIGCAAGLMIGMISFIGTVLSMVLGQGIARLLPRKLPNILGGLIIFAVGLTSLLRYGMDRGAPEPEQNITDRLSWRESLVLGTALAVNNAGLGVGASITGMGILPTAFLVLLLCLLFLYAGNRLGRTRATSMAGKYAEALANILMAVLGIYEMLI